MSILGIDYMDIFKCISLKLIAMQHLFETYWHMRGKLVLIQIVNPTWASGKDVEEANREAYVTVKRINKRNESSGYQPVILIDRYEKTAYYGMADCCLLNTVKDSMNLVSYKYIICRYR